MSPSSKNVLTVSSLNRQVKRLLEQEVGIVWVSGEISNFIRAQSGHWYFTLKDSNSQLKGACFRGNNQRLHFLPKNGDKVLARVRVSLYEPRGDYQVIAEFMEPDGDGLLKVKFEQLKAELFRRGLFDQSAKKPLPILPTKVGIVTSATGAAVHDIISVFERRAPNIQLTVYPTQVQGDTASSQIAQMIQVANARREVDVLIVGRGGGSLEDLWSFNEEPVALAIANSELPIISAVGHEVDVTIADYVADVRAATPSAAAEMLSQHQTTLHAQYEEVRHKLKDKMSQILIRHQMSLKAIQSQLMLLHPNHQLEKRSQQCDLLSQALYRGVQAQLESKDYQLRQLSTRITSHTPTQRIEQLNQSMQSLRQRLQHQVQTVFDTKEREIASNAHLLNAFNPLAILTRGYSATFKDERVVNTVKQLNIDDMITTRVHDGTAVSEVTKIIPFK